MFTMFSQSFGKPSIIRIGKAPTRMTQFVQSRFQRGSLLSEYRRRQIGLPRFQSEGIFQQLSHMSGKAHRTPCFTGLDLAVRGSGW